MRIDKLFGAELEKELRKAVYVWRTDEDMRSLKVMRQRFYRVPQTALKARLEAEGLFPYKPVFTMSNLRKKAKVPGQAWSFA